MIPDFQLRRGQAPLLISLPHDGTALPAEIAARMTAAGLEMADTDWHVGQLYAFAAEFGATILAPSWSRYVIDLNRPADGAALYPGRRETGLVPLISFAEEPLYRPDLEPTPEEIAARVQRYWQPYHQALAEELARLRAAHERVVLWEGHSIRSRVPLFFEGELPTLNLGTAEVRSCALSLRTALHGVLAAQTEYPYVIDGRFKGGYITRSYGRPDQGVHAVQMEMTQASYMREDGSYLYLPERAARVQQPLRQLLSTAIDWALIAD